MAWQLKKIYKKPILRKFYWNTKGYDVYLDNKKIKTSQKIHWGFFSSTTVGDELIPLIISAVYCMLKYNNKNNNNKFITSGDYNSKEKIA